MTGFCVSVDVTLRCAEACLLRDVNTPVPTQDISDRAGAALPVIASLALKAVMTTWIIAAVLAAGEHSDITRYIVLLYWKWVVCNTN